MSWYGIFGSTGQSPQAPGAQNTNQQASGQASNQLAGGHQGQNQGQANQMSGLAAWVNQTTQPMSPYYNGPATQPFFGVNRDTSAEREAARMLMLKKWQAMQPELREACLMSYRIQMANEQLFGQPLSNSVALLYTISNITPALIEDLTQSHLTAVLEETMLRQGEE